MRSNIKYNLIKDDYFILNNNKLYIDYNDNLLINLFGSNCKNLELVYNNKITHDMKNIIYSDNENKHILYDQDNTLNINTSIFNSNSKFSGFPRITPTIIYNKGTWKTKNDQYISDDINDIYIDYPINLLSPNNIVIEGGESQILKSHSKTKILNVLNNTEYELEFDINVPVFNDKESFKVYLIPCLSKLKRMYCVTNKIFYDINRINYKIKFNTSIFYDQRYDTFKSNYKIDGDKYYIALQSNETSNIYLSDPTKYIFITNKTEYKLINFSINPNQLSYQTSRNKELLIEFNVCGLLLNTYFNLRISELNNNIYYSPDILFEGDKIYYQNIIIPDINNHEYTVELVYNNDSMCDLKSYINVDIDYNRNITILSKIVDDNSRKIKMILYFDEKFINSLVNISLNNIFIENVIITKNNYTNYELNVDIDNRFIPNEYYVRVQTSGVNKYYAKSSDYIRINNINQENTIIPNFGYPLISYTSHPNYKSIKSNNKIFIVPDGVTKINVTIIYNKIRYNGQIKIKPKSVIEIKSNNSTQLIINNNKFFLLCLDETKNVILKDNIENYTETNEELLRNITEIDYICENGYIIQLDNNKIYDEFLYVYTANNSNSKNLKFYKMVKVKKDDILGQYIQINEKTYFDFRGKIYFYIRDSSKLDIYIGYINILEYPVNCLINIINNINNTIKKNEIVRCKIMINNKTNKYFDIYFVNDLIGNAPYYLTLATNNDGIIDISFIYSSNDTLDTKYIMICSKNDNNIINKIINTPITIENNNTINIDELIKSEISSNNVVSKINYSTKPVTDITGVYTTFDTPPNKITPTNFLERFGLYKYKSITTFGDSYANYEGYLILQTDPLSNSISQTNQTLDSFITYLISQLANKKINVINVPCIFKYNFITTEFIAETHTFEYYNNTIYNNTLINIQNSLCLRTIQNNELISNISTIQTNFTLAYNDEIRNYTEQNSINEQINTVSELTSVSPRFSWIEDLGHYIGQYYDLTINNVNIETITSDWMNIWNEVSLPIGHLKGYNKMIGNIDELTNFTSFVKPKRQIKIPLKFYFNRYQNTGMSIPMISLLHSDVKLTIQLDKLENLIISDPLTKITSSGRPKLRLYTTYVYLDNEERKIFAQNKHEYLIEQQNYRNYSHTGKLFQTKINLSQPVKDLFWVAPPKVNKINKQYFNYTTSKFYRLPKNYDRYDEVNPVTQLSRKLYAQLYKKYPTLPYIPLYINGNIKKAPLPAYSGILSSELVLNGQKRFKEERDLTTKINFMRYNNIPVSGINVYSFARYPNEYQPSGSCNFSQLGDAFISLETESGDYDVKIIARNYNLLRIMGGQAGLAFEIN